MKTKTIKKKTKKEISESVQAPSAWIVPEKSYSITLTIGDKTLKGEGNTPFEALQAIPKPQKILNKGTFFMTDGVKKTNKLLMFPVRLRRLFYSKLSQEIQLKSLLMGMK